MTDKGTRPASAAVNAATAPSLHFCFGLARHVKAAFPAKLSQDSWRSALGAKTPDPSELTVARIARDYLLPNVSAQSRLSALLEYPPSKWLLEQEMEARGNWKPSDEESLPPRDVYEVAFEQNLKGVCFSGGGIRSATFNLGILQALAARNKLGVIDYLSTVSGGGYIHHFLASWITCENLAKVQEQLRPLPGESTRTAWPDPVRWLRRYSNYLTPSKGLLTADTWVAVSIWLRNTILNQIVLLSTLMFILVLPHLPLLYFDPASQTSSPVTGGILPAIGAIAFFAFSAFHLARGLWKSHDHDEERIQGAKGAAVQNSNDAQDRDPGHTKRIGYGGKRVFFLILMPVYLALFVVSPFLYRSAFPGIEKDVQKATSSPGPGIPQLVDTLQHLKPQSAATDPAAIVPAAAKSEPGFIENTKYWYENYKNLPLWTPLEKPLRFILIAFLAGLALVVAALSAAIPSNFNRAFPVLAAILVVILAALGMLHVARLILFVAAIGFDYSALVSFAVVFAPILLLTVIFISMDLAIGTIGRCMHDSSREWLARVRSLSFLSGFAWLAVVGSSRLGPVLVTWLFQLHWKWLTAAVTSWIGTSAASILAGKSRATSGPSDAVTSSTSALEILVAVGPPVFLVGIMLAVSWVVQYGIDAFALTGLKSLLLTVAGLGAFALFFSWRVDINEFSMHAFYRDRIARCYAGASNPDRRPNAFSGLASSDTRLRLADLLPVRFGSGNPSLWAKDDARPTYEGPFPIFSATLNLTFGADLATQERKAAAFAFTPLFCGYDVGWTEGTSPQVQFNGFVPTRTFAYPQGGPHVSTAVAASGAALNPNEGFHTSTAMAALLTIFNARLGWWIPNPRNLRSKMVSRLSGPTPILGLPYLVRELFGEVSDDAPYVSVSDGGHFENMGLYELVRRRCRTIIICDAESDSGFVFEGLGMAIRKCRIDFGAEIVDLDLDNLVAAPNGFSGYCYAEGRIIYPAQEVAGKPGPKPVTGHVLYLKSTLTGKEPSDIRNYKREHAEFPSDSTLNQWFTESQFESYRRLGQWVGEDAKVQNWLDKYFNSVDSSVESQRELVS